MAQPFHLCAAGGESGPSYDAWYDPGEIRGPFGYLSMHPSPYVARYTHKMHILCWVFLGFGNYIQKYVHPTHAVPFAAPPLPRRWQGAWAVFDLSSPVILRAASYLPNDRMSQNRSMSRHAPACVIGHFICRMSETIKKTHCLPILVAAGVVFWRFLMAPGRSPTHRWWRRACMRQGRSRPRPSCSPRFLIGPHFGTRSCGSHAYARQRSPTPPDLTQSLFSGKPEPVSMPAASPHQSG